MHADESQIRYRDFQNHSDRGTHAGDDDEIAEDFKERTSLRDAYSQLYAVIKLPAMRKFTLVLVACRLGMLPAEQVGDLVFARQTSFPKLPSA